MERERGYGGGGGGGEESEESVGCSAHFSGGSW